MKRSKSDKEMAELMAQAQAKMAPSQGQAKKARKSALAKMLKG